MKNTNNSTKPKFQSRKTPQVLGKRGFLNLYLQSLVHLKSQAALILSLAKHQEVDS